MTETVTLTLKNYETLKDIEKNYIKEIKKYRESQKKIIQDLGTKLYEEKIKYDDLKYKYGKLLTRTLIQRILNQEPNP
jgi:hypothetical protein